jgi:hypothetical protein
MRLALIMLTLAAGTARAAAQSKPESAAALPINLGSLVARDDSFAIRLQGAELGWIRAELEATAQAIRYVERTRVAEFVEQATTVELSRTGAMLSVRQDGKAQGQATSIELSYRNNRVTGTATVNGPDGPKVITIDTTVPPGTIDENALQAILPALPWAIGAWWRAGVFSGTQNEYRVTELRVVAADTVRSAAGPIEAFRAEWTGAWQPATFWISTAAPHRILRMTVAGAPLEVVRVK